MTTMGIPELWEQHLADAQRPATPGDSETDRRQLILTRSSFERLCIEIEAAERAKPTASDYKLAGDLVESWCENPDIWRTHGMPSNRKLAKLAAGVAAALAERGRVERERAAKIAETFDWQAWRFGKDGKDIIHAPDMITVAIRNQTLTGELNG